MKNFEKSLRHIAETYTQSGLIIGTMWLAVEAVCIVFFVLMTIYFGVHWVMYWLLRVLFGKNASAFLLNEEGKVALHSSKPAW